MFSIEYITNIEKLRNLQERGFGFTESFEQIKFRLTKPAQHKRATLSRTNIEKLNLKKNIEKLSRIVKEEEVTISTVIQKYMKLTGGLGILSIIYEAVEFFYRKKELPLPKRPSIRGIMIDHEVEKGRKKTKFFKRLSNGIYSLLGLKSAKNVVNGDGRGMAFLEDGSIDAIITDHPWEDKKAHKAGNQSNFNDSYENNMFAYTEEDFKQKHRVLKEGGYLVEMLPFFLHSNIKYLVSVIQKAIQAGFEFYSEILWVWDNGEVAKTNTGRTTKRSMKLFVFTKGKARRLSAKGKPYMTNGNLDQLLFIDKPKNKKHQSEKPVSLYRYLIEKLTNEGDVVLDQYAGSGNIIDAADEAGRHAIAIEYNRSFADKISERFGMKTILV